MPTYMSVYFYDFFFQWQVKNCIRIQGSIKKLSPLHNRKFSFTLTHTFCSLEANLKRRMQKLRWYAHYACQRSSKKIQWKITIWKLNSKFSRILRSRRISRREFQLISGFQFLIHSALSTAALEAFSLATVMQCCIYIFWLVNNLKKKQPI